MSLPILTGTEDVRAIVSYLKTKPAGAFLSDAKAAIKKQALDPRKITAYTMWDIVSKDGERLKLTQRGWDFARGKKSEEHLFREVIDGIVPYRSAMEWIFHQELDAVTNVDIASHWHEHHPEALGTDNENTIKDQAVCYMRIFGAAGLGSFTIGRHGQSTRLIIDREALKKHIEEGPSAPPWTEPTAPADGAPSTDDTIQDETLSPPPKGEKKTTLPPQKDEKLCVFISHGRNQEIVEQVETMLGLADIQSEIAVKEETSAIPVPDKVFSAMRRCVAGIIIVSAEEGNKDAKGNYRINENVLIEIGAAFVLYDRRVVLLWDKRLPVPSNLQGLYRCEYEGDDLNWSAGMKLMKAIKDFKK